ncbi:ubiquitin-protein ligase [Lithospermum erythrorhizon]|uniref:RING-type E3 ubiquitin transferase n=1 Tax=Lithospermum erythrorhizon TaxID=34254 RepID=A0AAV3RGF1_LITER
MSVHDDAVAAVVAQLTLAADGAFIGVALAYVAVRSLLKLRSTSSALRQIERAPSLHVSDLRSLLEIDDSQSSSCGKLVIVRGVVDSKSSVNGDWRSTVLVGHESGEKGVILQRTQTCIYHEWKGFFGWSQELRSLLTRKQPKSSSMRMVPFVLADAGSWPHSKYVIVNMDGSRHPLPLVTVYHHFQPVSATPYTFLQALFGHQYPVGLVDEEKILPLGKEITAVGFCTLKSGTPEIKSSKDLPYFLSDLSKDQMILDLAFKTKLFLWTGVVLGVVAVGVLSYATMRNWTKWKEWRHGRQARQHDATESDDPDAQIVTDDDNGEVPDGELCVICLTRRRRSAFVPCGHLVCCQRCALRIEREGDKKCPVCMQPFQKSVRIYNS